VTEQELAALFTPKSDELLKVREVLVQRIELEIKLIRTNYPNAMLDYTNGLARASFIIRDLIDFEGKILKEDLK